MGYGSYTAGDWAKLKASKPSIASGSASQIFASKQMNPKYDPKFVEARESRDSEEHPNSTPIMIGVDVTGSMGYLSEQIIKDSLNELMQKLYSSSLIQDPQMLFAAIGDAVCDKAPLQVTQFEADIRVAEQLLELWLENGGGDSPEDYELLWYFADKHTRTDCYDKRGQKGFCFTIGDAGFHPELGAQSIRRIFNDPFSRTMTSMELAKRAGEKYELFHIVVDGSSDTFDNAARIIPGRVLKVSKSEIRYLPEIIISTMLLTRGMTKQEILNQWGENARAVVERALSHLCFECRREIRF